MTHDRTGALTGAQGEIGLSYQYQGLVDIKIRRIHYDKIAYVGFLYGPHRGLSTVDTKEIMRKTRKFLIGWQMIFIEIFCFSWIIL